MDERGSLTLLGREVVLDVIGGGVSGALSETIWAMLNISTNTVPLQVLDTIGNTTFSAFLAGTYYVFLREQQNLFNLSRNAGFTISFTASQPVLMAKWISTIASVKTWLNSETSGSTPQANAQINTSSMEGNILLKDLNSVEWSQGTISGMVNQPNLAPLADY